MTETTGAAIGVELDRMIAEQRELVARLRAAYLAGEGGAALTEWRYEAGVVEGLRMARRLVR